jgi:hypothetical protein
VRFWLPWVLDALIGAILLCFFFAGLAGGTVSSFNAGIWLALLAIPAVVLGGSLWLRAAGRRGLALALALVLAVPALLAVLFALVVLITQPRWN